MCRVFCFDYTATPQIDTYCQPLSLHAALPISAPRPRRHFTVGIYDDVSHLSRPMDGTLRYDRPDREVQAVFVGLGSDGTVGANKSSVKIIGEGTDLHAQRSEERRVGKECVSTCRSRWSPSH